MQQDEDDDDSIYGKRIIGHNTNTFLQLSGSRRTSKKLSVVPEQDEQVIHPLSLSKTKYF